MFARINNVRVRGVRATVPPVEISIDDEVEYYNGSLKKVSRLRQMIGLNKRRICPEGVTASDLCAHAAESLLKELGVDRAQVDALLFLSQSPDYVMPATSCVLQHRLGLSSGCAALDLSQGCSGYIYGLWTAASLVASGGARMALLLVGDALPPRVPENRVVAPIFGEGGSATLLCREEGAPPLAFSLGTDGAGYETICVPAGRARRPLSLNRDDDAELYTDFCDESGNPWRMTQPFMDGSKTFEFSITTVPAHLRGFMEHEGVTPDDVNALVLHQANRQIVENVTANAGFPPEKAFSETFSNYGNLACASVPAALCDMFGAAGKAGDLVLMSGFGVGLSWASCLMRGEGTDVAAVRDYASAAPPLSRADFMRHWRDIFTGKEE